VETRVFALLLAVSLVAASNIPRASEKRDREGERNRPPVVLTDRDVQRGYVVYWTQGQEPYEPAGPAYVTMGAQERRSFELGVVALIDLGEVRLRVQSEPILADLAVQWRIQPGVHSADTGDRRASDELIEGNSRRLVRADHERFGFTVEASHCKPGRYFLEFHVEPEKAPERVVPMILDVLKAGRVRPGQPMLVNDFDDLPCGAFRGTRDLLVRATEPSRWMVTKTMFSKHNCLTFDNSKADAGPSIALRVAIDRDDQGGLLLVAADDDKGLSRTLGETDFGNSPARKGGGLAHQCNLAVLLDGASTPGSNATRLPHPWHRRSRHSGRPHRVSTAGTS